MISLLRIDVLEQPPTSIHIQFATDRCFSDNVQHPFTYSQFATDRCFRDNIQQPFTYSPFATDRCFRAASNIHSHTHSLLRTDALETASNIHLHTHVLLRIDALQHHPTSIYILTVCNVKMLYSTIQYSFTYSQFAT